jgi:DNA-binding winged helix-turn-helix (wHTH) protein
MEPPTMPPGPAAWVLDVYGSRLCYGATEVRLQPARRWILEALCVAKGEVVLHERMSWEMASGEMATPDVMKVHVCRLRAKIRRAGLPPLIETAHGIGYRLGHPVTVINADDPPVVIPGALRRPLVRLLHSHPDHREADRVLAVIG